MTPKKSQNKRKNIFIFTFCILSFALTCYAQEEKIEPITVNGDRVEYLTDSKDFTVTGSAEVIYKGTKLTCKKLTLNSQTKDSTAEGDVRLEEKDGVIEGTKMIYNFESRTGVIFDADFRSNPYFGRSKKVDKVSENEFIARFGYMTTCSYNEPHWKIKSKKINFFPGDKVQTRDDVLYFRKAPVFYAPRYSHSLKDPLMHVQLMPGKRKEWGSFLLTAWRYNLTDNMTGRIYFDYRELLGVAEGFGTNYNSVFGKGDFKYYYTQERHRKFDEGVPAEFQRYLIRLRHKWDIDLNTSLTTEYYKIVDSKRILHGGTNNFLKDYFFREYEKDAQPLSYVLIHRTFGSSIMDIHLQKRVNRWYSQAEKLPEIKYTLPSLQLGYSPFYFENNSSFINSNTKSPVPSDAFNDVSFNKWDTSNKFSLPMKAAFFNLTPSITAQQVYFDRSTFGSTLQFNFSTGSDLSTKFYRFFDVKTNLLGLDINKLRHIITPSAGYSYSKNSTTPASALRIGGGAITSTGASISLGLSNKLQTKRKDKTLDLVDFNITNSYSVKPKSGDKRGSSLSDFLFKLKLLPYSWLTVNLDTTLDHTGKHSDPNYNKFSNLNYDFNFNFGTDRTVNLGQRYTRKGTNEISFDFDWRLNPKWKFSFYQRRNRGHQPGIKRGLKEQEYSISRDLHCWIVDFTYNVKKGESAGEAVWMIFRLKAFPELEFEYNKSYHAPKPGSQSNP